MIGSRLDACELPQARTAGGELRGRRWLITSFVMCPCHLPVTLGLLALIGGGSAFGAFVRGNGWVIGSIVTVLWLAGTARGFWLIRQAVTVVHYPPGTRKWNKIEHRLFSFISMNWRGRSLTDIRTIVELISATTTTTGLTVQAVYDNGWYAKGIKISNTDYETIPLAPHDWHGEWNYTITAT